MDEYYYKATRSDGSSYYGGEPVIIYKEGMIIHPAPDRKSDASCGAGIHLAKTLGFAKRYCITGGRIFLAKAGVILGEDSEKVRCASCFVVRELSADDIKRAENEAELQKKLGAVWATGGLCGKDWLIQHLNDVTQEDIDNQGLELITNNHKVVLKAGMKKGNIKTALTAVMA
jgi:hypothetical protein